jgi:hypothetical protein
MPPDKDEVGREPDPAEAAARQTRREYAGEGTAVQLPLFEDAEAISIPNHPLALTEWDLRFTVNTMPRGRSHWWIADLRWRSA